MPIAAIALMSYSEVHAQVTGKGKDAATKTKDVTAEAAKK
jgi:hypothetical protein